METDDEATESFSEMNLFDHYYKNVSDRSELSKRTERKNILNGQAAFFSLITRMNVPILDRSSNQSGGQDYMFVGAGASFGVTQALFALSSSHTQTINKNRGQHGKLREEVMKRRYVTKRINPQSSLTDMDDSQKLAAITNEVRILANETLRESRHLVRLLCVAWDEVPTQGRCWPRLLLEAAPHGNLGEFLASSPHASDWDVKVELLMDVMSGLKALHNHGVAHCDLKMENVLVFPLDEGEQHPLGVKYQAKICDFGFSVILNDFEENDTFSERLGTEPWSSPELTFGTEIALKNLPQSDIYSLGLLLARVFMDGGNPFEGLSPDEIRDMKQEKEEDVMILHRHITNAIFSKVEYPHGQSLLIQKLLLVTLLYNPEHRFPIHLIGYELILLGVLFRERKGDAVDDGDAKTVSGDTTVGEPENANPGPRSLGSRLTGFLRSCVSVVFAPVRFVGRIVGSASLRLLRMILKRVGLIHDPLDDLFKPKEIHVEPIQRIVPSSLRLADNDEEPERFTDIPDFEEVRRFSPITLSASSAREVVQNLIEMSNSASGSQSKRAAEAEYQLAVTSFEGIGGPKNPEECLRWLEKAALRGSKKAISALTPWCEAMNLSMSPGAREEVNRKLPEIAKDELHMSSSSLFNGDISQSHEFPTVRQWKESSPDAFTEYVESPEYLHLRSRFLSLCLVMSGIPGGKESFDFRLLRGYDLTSLERFDVRNKSEFVQSVRALKCLKSTGTLFMTLLQIAAASGDLELVKTLVEDLGADVHDVGIAAGMTPLWMACFNGHAQVALFLVQHGANAACRDEKSKRTIFHFLNQFSREEDILNILQVGLSAGLTIEERDKNGYTPLLSTFIGWDFSNGLAARFLLAIGANTLVESQTDWSPLCAAMTTLDYESAQCIINEFQTSMLQAAGRLEVPALSPGEAKANAVGTLMTSSEFYRRRTGGAEGTRNLQRIMEILLDDDMLAAMRSTDFSGGSNPLLGACFIGHDDIAAAILGSTNCPPLNDTDEMNQMSALHWAVERGRASTAIKLLSLGANPLLRDQEGLTAFHRAARFSPFLLVDILERIDAGSFPRQEGLDSREILALVTPSGETPFAIAVIEGSSEHLQAAEILRTKYQLAHDTLSMRDHTPGLKLTLTAYLVMSTITSNLFTLQQAEYLLNINPRPRFVADSSGGTLLHYAVSGWQHGEISNNPAGYAVLRHLLRMFPGKKHLSVGNDSGYNVIHYAIYHSNILALEIIQEHLHSIGETLDPNMASDGAPPPLHAMGGILTKIKLREEDEPRLFSVIKSNTVKTYVFMRNLGASLLRDREPVMVSVMTRGQEELSYELLLSFLKYIQREYGVGWELIEGDIPSSLLGTAATKYAVELCWVFDNFMLRATPLIADELAEHITARFQARLRATKGETEYPWMKQEYQENVCGQNVSWKRRGKLWTVEERKELTERIEREWSSLFPSDDISDATSQTVRFVPRIYE